MQGTHPTLVEALEPHTQKMAAIVSQADRIRQLQIANIDALFECEKKMAEDENKAQLEFFKQRLIDQIEEKLKKAAQQAGSRSREGKGGAAGGAGGKRKRGDAGASNSGSGSPPSLMPVSYVLKADDLKADIDEITANVDHYSVRSAAAASEELRSGSSPEAYFDRSRQLLHCNGQSFERGATVYVHMQGQRVDDTWTLTAMNAVEVTLRDPDGTKLKVTLAQLRNGRYAFRYAGY